MGKEKIKMPIIERYFDIKRLDRVRVTLPCGFVYNMQDNGKSDQFYLMRASKMKTYFLNRKKGR